MRRHLPLLAICLGYFMVILDATIVNVALPSVQRELGGGVSSLQWIIDAYTVVFAGLLLSAGSLGDRIGARRVFDAGLSLFTISSAAGAAAPSVAVLIGARVAQGVGAAMLVPSSLALLPEGAFVAIASALSGRVTGRVGPRLPMLCGLICGAAGFAGLVAAGHSTPYLALVPALIAAGFGMAFTMPAATAAVIESAPASRAGIASGVLNAARQCGGAIGVALLGTLVAGSSFVPGLHLAMAASAAAFATGAVVTAFAVR
jgi:DHA2 family methylenomycin A resistance protein-like MFS transporter